MIAEARAPGAAGAASAAIVVLLLVLLALLVLLVLLVLLPVLAGVRTATTLRCALCGSMAILWSVRVVVLAVVLPAGRKHRSGGVVAVEAQVAESRSAAVQNPMGCWAARR